MRISKHRTESLPSASHRPDHLRSEVFHDMAERVEKHQEASAHAYAHLRASARIDPRRLPVLWWFVAGIAVVAVIASIWIFWDQILALF